MVPPQSPIRPLDGDALRDAFQSAEPFAFVCTAEAPEGWDGTTHGTEFRARPDERLKGRVLMPLQSIARKAYEPFRRDKKRP